MPTYEIWTHRYLYEWAVRLEGREVTGVCGPLDLSTAADCEPETFLYDARSEALARFRESPEQFALLEHWWRGQWVTPGSQPRRVPWWVKMVGAMEIVRRIGAVLLVLRT